jgi:hypothetical protein
LFIKKGEKIDKVAKLMKQQTAAAEATKRLKMVVVFQSQPQCQVQQNTKIRLDRVSNDYNRYNNL